MARLAVVLVLTLLLEQLAPAKRIAPVKVDPVKYEGVRYEAPTDNGRRAYIEAWDVATNKKLWELTIFTNHIDPHLEEDVQWIFINALRIQDGRVIAASDDGRTYQIDLKTKAITHSDLRSRASLGATLELPAAVRKTLTNGSAGKKYDISHRIKPCYLKGDFNGDGNADLAVLVTQRSTGKIGIVLVHGRAGKLAVLGAGIGIGNGGDDFEWMDSWRVYPKTHAARSIDETGATNIRGDALLVEKSESAGALIYWNGNRYVWSQQGD